jgi:hypothetical protein
MTHASIKDRSGTHMQVSDEDNKFNNFHLVSRWIRLITKKQFISVLSVFAQKELPETTDVMAYIYLVVCPFSFKGTYILVPIFHNRKNAMIHTTSSCPSMLNLLSNRVARSMPSADSHSQKPNATGFPLLGFWVRFQLLTGPQI